MRISTKGRYALQAVVVLALNGGNSCISLREIGKKANLSEGYLEQLFIPLKRNKIVKSVKGTSGGYLLVKPSDQITVAEVLVSVEGSLAPVKCLDKDMCARAEKCVSKGVWGLMHDEINSVVRGITIANIVGRYEDNNKIAAMNYMI